ncbi:hypothetical protein M011DRAFT_437999 [Sporormia fimetaria CBS 119925]|uniref:Uncharacterized protein n=1 Tax=Sporormia fimetaria CBS 119925 TaxID=1340428 RepID=A0A6A6VHN1_9PLEO|nr:hypothetical protein M011DRAFT_437999 [Sporormia fimetaria CBS 119925]
MEPLEINWDADIDKATREIREEMEAAKADHQRELEVVKAKHSEELEAEKAKHWKELEAEKAKHRNELEAEKAKQRELEEKNEELRHQLESVEEEEKDLVSALAHATKENDELKARTLSGGGGPTDTDKLVRAIQVLTDNLDKAEAQLALTSKECREKESIINDIREEIIVVRDENGDLRNMVASLRRKLVKDARAGPDLERKNALLQQENTELWTDLTRETEKNDRQLKTEEKLRRDMSMLEDRIKTLEYLRKAKGPAQCNVNPPVLNVVINPEDRSHRDWVEKLNRAVARKTEVKISGPEVCVMEIHQLMAGHISDIQRIELENISFRTRIRRLENENARLQSKKTNLTIYMYERRHQADVKMLSQLTERIRDLELQEESRKDGEIVLQNTLQELQLELQAKNRDGADEETPFQRLKTNEENRIDGEDKGANVKGVPFII